MNPTRLFVLAVLNVCLAASSARAADAEAVVESKAEAKQQQAAPLSAVVRGLYIETRVGGGYMVVNSDLKPTAQDRARFPDAAGTEELGAGAFLGFALGYDLTDNLAFQLLGGSALVSSGRTDIVRDLALLYGGAGLRLGVDLDERLDLVVSAGGAMARQDNGVEKVTSSPAFLGGVGLEYYVHVRHFSIGLDLTAFLPLSPMRAFVGLGPQIKYTF